MRNCNMYYEMEIKMNHSFYLEFNFIIEKYRLGFYVFKFVFLLTLLN